RGPRGPNRRRVRRTPQPCTGRARARQRPTWQSARVLGRAPPNSSEPFREDEDHQEVDDGEHREDQSGSVVRRTGDHCDTSPAGPRSTSVATSSGPVMGSQSRTHSGVSTKKANAIPRKMTSLMRPLYARMIEPTTELTDP